jgi:serine/threonine-protein phosphatase 2B catalytic subunit
MKYDSEIYERIMESFDALPLACLINEKFICVHGGISPSLSVMEELNKVSRFSEPPKDGALW